MHALTGFMPAAAEGKSIRIRGIFPQDKRSGPGKERRKI